jgi:hypothetical protein
VESPGGASGGASGGTAGAQSSKATLSQSLHVSPCVPVWSRGLSHARTITSNRPITCENLLQGAPVISVTRRTYTSDRFGSPIGNLCRSCLVCAVYASCVCRVCVVCVSCMYRARQAYVSCMFIVCILYICRVLVPPSTAHHGTRALDQQTGGCWSESIAAKPQPLDPKQPALVKEDWIVTPEPTSLTTKA